MLSVSNTTHQKIPSLPIEDLKIAILGNIYDLSVVFIGDTRSRRLNKQHKNKDTPASVLSFPLEKDMGEIYLNLTLAKRRAGHYDMNYKQFVGYLLIHGMLHLKGFDHGSTMEGHEKKLCQKFNIPY